MPAAMLDEPDGAHPRLVNRHSGLCDFIVAVGLLPGLKWWERLQEFDGQLVHGLALGSRDSFDPKISDCSFFYSQRCLQRMHRVET
jgi:hypothetical protein